MDDRINFKTFFFLIRNQVYSNKHEEINAKKREKAKARERQIRHNCSKIKRNKLYRKKKISQLNIIMAKEQFIWLVLLVIIQKLKRFFYKNLIRFSEREEILQDHPHAPVIKTACLA